VAGEDERIVLTGYAFGEDYAQLSSHAHAFLLPSAVDGTRPVLLDQMGFGNCVVVRDSRVNREVVGDWGLRFDREEPVEGLREAIERLEREPDLADQFRRRVRERIETYYNWEWVTDFYESLFLRQSARHEVPSYEQSILNKYKTSRDL
jgi:glycosyltransferase involved in cell wall biosynthesis